MTDIGVRRRQGLAAARAALTAGESSIAYLGNSITAQKAGYRPLLHTRLEAMTGHHHRSINAGIGGVGSLGCGFLLPEIVLRHEPRLCFVECTSADMGGATPAWAVAGAVDGIVGRLLDAGTDVCLLHMTRGARVGGDAAVLTLYERVAEHYGVPSIDVGKLVTAVRPATAELGPDILSDGVHTSAAGSALIAGLVADSLAEFLAIPGGQRTAIQEPLCAGHLRHAAIVPARAEMCDDTSTVSSRRFKLVFPYLNIGPGNSCRWSTNQGDLLGLLVVVGPDSGVITVSDGDDALPVQLWDQWCDRERLQAVILDRPCPSGVALRVEMTAADVAPRGACGNRDPVSRAGSRLQLIGFMVRQYQAFPVPRLLAG